jgi:hypothetical protein
MTYPLEERALVAYGRGPKGEDGDVSTAALAAAIAVLVGTASPGADTLGELEALLGLKAPLASPAFTGVPTVPTAANGTNSTQAASAAFVQQELTNTLLTYVPKSGATMTGLLTLSADPSSALHAATKQYVDSVAAGLDVRASVKAATTANITLSGAQTIDGISIVAGDRVLVKNQSAPAQNGIYVAASGAWARAADMDAWTELPGAFCFVEQGTVFADTAFVCTVDQGGTLGLTSIIFSQFAGAGTYSAGTGLSLTGTVFALSDPELLAIAGLTSAADKGIYFTGSGTAGLFDLTAFGRSLADDADASAARTTLGLAIGSDVQAFDSDLAALAALSGTNTIYYRSAANTWTAVTIGALLSFAGGTLNVGDAELAAIAGLTSAADKLPYFTGAGAAALADFTAAGRALVDDANATAQRATLGVVIGTDVQAFDATLAALAGVTTAANKLIYATGVDAFSTTDLTAFARTLLDDADAATALATLGAVPLAGGTMSGLLTLSADPSNALHAATKQYVDSVAAGLDVKPSVKAATTANITLSGAQTIDGVSIVAGDRVLVKNQSTASQNGIYVAASGSWTRATDMDAWSEVPGSFCFVEQGSTFADSAFVCTADQGGTLGSTSITFSQFSAAGTYSAGTGLSLTGTTFAIADAELLAIAGLTSAADKLAYFTGSGTASLADFTAAGRALLDDANAAAQRTTLGLGSAALEAYTAPTPWSPNLQFGGANVGLTYATQSGSAVLIGKMAVIGGRITLLTKGSSTGAASLSNLPYPVAPGINVSAHCSYYANMSGLSAVLGGYAGSSTLNFTGGGAANAQTVNETNFTNSSDIMFSLAYPTA